MNIIELQNVSKSYGNNLILNQINLTVKPGELIILEGDNGSGKTTLINLILGLKNLDSGTIEVFGHSPDNPKSRLQLGCMPQKARVPDHLKVRELINLIRSYYPNPLSYEKIEEFLTLTKLKDKEYKPASELSGGQERWLYFLLSIIGNPDLLILDEPTRDLAQEKTQQFLQQVKNFVREGKTVIFISHSPSDKEELKDLATRTLTLSQGQIREENTVRYEQILNTETKAVDEPKFLEKFKLGIDQLLSSLFGQLSVELLDWIRDPLLLGCILVISIMPPLFFPKNPDLLWNLLIFIAAISPLIQHISDL